MSPMTTTGFAEIRARQALREAELPWEGSLQRASSTRNEVFLADDHVVRFNIEPSDRLSREARIYQLLADRPWVPDVVAHGDRVGADFLIVTRRPGIPLSRCWPTMAPARRHRAIRQFAACLADLHQVRNDGTLLDIGPTPHLLGDLDPIGPLIEGLDRLAATAGAEPHLVAEARKRASSLAGALDRGPHETLIHGDLTLENVLWDGSQITAIVDFEWCRPGPADLDLDVLGRYFWIPGAHLPVEAADAQDREDYRHAPAWMAQTYPALFEHPQLPERLLLYALAFEVRDVLASPLPADKSKLNPLHPYRRLDHLLATGGHVTELLAELGLPTL